MTKKVFAALAVIAIALPAFAPVPAKWSIDKSHSRLGFSISHMTVSEVDGSFRITESSITTEKEDFTNATVTLVADVNTVDTDNADRDAHLKKPDFFDAAKYPQIVFRSTSFTKNDVNNYTVKGNLTLHGVTREVELQARAGVTTHPMNKKQLAGFKITGAIKRSDFGIAVDTPSAMLGDEVTINANVEFTKD
jgi:polyisoprenoid-binding protein YceI